jgi:hypothetical protein
MIEASVITWLSGGTAAGTRVYTGARMQETDLPALVVQVTQSAAASIGPSPLKRHTVTVSAVAETMASAQSIATACAALMATGAVGASGVSVETELPRLEEPVLGDGDEAEPAICNAYFEVYL